MQEIKGNAVCYGQWASTLLTQRIGGLGRVGSVFSCGTALRGGLSRQNGQTQAEGIQGRVGSRSAILDA